ncbi:MAG TPA: FAD-binding oxidoreductase [Kofleriaceae bacterium]|nr:FAD-binding oxidoreductase [Kofleriaceae bacterium]
MNRRNFMGSVLAATAVLQARRLMPAFAAGLPDIPARSLTGGATTLRGADIKDLAASMRGQVLVAGDAGYDAARRVWNAVYDKRPALIARCASPSDVMRAVDFARGHRLLTAVRAGGHSQAGKSTCTGGIVIDVSPMQSVRVDPRSRIARVEGGALLQHLDRESRPFGLVTTTGTVSHTGAAGLTLGGGLGRVGRRFGLACDNLRSVDLVTAGGKLITASQAQNPDLFWALRGAGANFGVATSFEYQLHPMNPTVLAGILVWPFAVARQVLTFYAEFSASAPDELNLDLFSFNGGDGAAMIGIEACWSADPARGERVLKPLRAFGRTTEDSIRAIPYTELQSSDDESARGGMRYHNKSGFLTELTPRAIDALVGSVEAAPPGKVALFIQQAGGAIGRVRPDDSAFPNRDARYWLMLVSSWWKAEEDAGRLAALRAAWRPIEPHTRGFYVNSMSEDQYQRVAANYGSHYARLVQLKKKLDPGNQFRLNANVVPG